MRISQKIKANKAHPIITGWPTKLLSTAILAFMASSAGHTSDLEIYQGATYGNASIMMMLDNSGSMGKGSISEDYSNLSSESSTTTVNFTQKLYDDNGVLTNTVYSYPVTYVEKSNIKYYDRMSRLKMALMPMFANPRSDEAFGSSVNLSKYKIGLGSFYFESEKNGGKIINPIVDLTLENRKNLLATVKSLSASTNTPTADAYAEAGAYMLGRGGASGSESTGEAYKIVGKSESELKNYGNYEHKLEKCIKYDNDTESKFGIEYKECDDYKKLQDDASSLQLNLLGGFDITKIKKKEAYYFKRVSDSGSDSVYKMLGEVEINSEDNGTYNYKIKQCTTNKSDTEDKKDYGIKYKKCGNSTNYNGTANEISDIYNILNSYGYDLEIIKEEKIYYFKSDSEESEEGDDSPIKGEANQCDGYGIYFLTDGEPNTSSSDTLKRMENSLKGSSLTMGSSCDSGLPSTGKYSEKAKWECIGEYSTKLYNKDNSKKTLIATATVGFGDVFKQLAEQPKTTKSIKRLGVVETVEVYDCDNVNIASQDAKNLCKLGEKGYDYGEGGFYYTGEPKDIANSVKAFIEDVSQAEIDSISAGTMSVPLDSLGGLKSRQFAYLPILEPIPGSPLLWNGNLKKYKVKNATLVGSDGKFVFADNTGLFAKDTYDEWNTINDITRPDTLRPDKAIPQVGGAYQKVFENATADVGNRNLFVDVGGSLVNPQVVTGNRPANFGSLTGYTDPQKLTLLNFMGYGESTATTVTDDTAITASLNTSLKNVGGVLHSIPQLITTKVAVDATGKFDTSQRQDYVIYGSMDGALHMLDDSTGKEVFAFVPKQILDLQPAALAGKGSAKDGRYPYGVDAPWLTYAAYTTKATTKATTTGTGDAATTVNTYEADQAFALGGLRMGGSMYYALDVSEPSTPKMIYSVGSNYANKLQDKPADTPTVLAGTINNTTSNATPEQKAFAKMGQSWGKPALGYVKSGGKRVMVSFLPGGYDTCYEDANFKLNDATNSKAACKSRDEAQGNGVYMVQVGEVETKTNNEEKVNASIGNGKLLWWANNGGTSVTAASNSTIPSLQYSKAADLKHSVVTQIRTLDRNYDGLIDHIYFADLGGQVWRADINNNADTNNFKVDRVVKVLDVSDQVGTGDAPPRIYERPLVTFYNDKFDYIDEANISGSARGVQAMITVGTGDRSNPVTATRNVPDALYNVIDKDVSRSDLFYYGTGTAPTITLRTPINKVAGTSGRNDKLQMLTFSAADNSKAATAAVRGLPATLATLGIKEKMQSGEIQGWYMPFDTWLNEAKQAVGPYKMKMFNEPDALAGILVSSTYNPDKGQAIQACSAGVKGETQRERTCLPYGTCLDGNGNGILTSRSAFNAGSGIVDNIVTQFNDTSIFSGLVNRCEGEDCQPKLICPSGDCDPVPPTCTGPTCSPLDGFNTDKRINPLSWIEH